MEHKTLELKIDQITGRKFSGIASTGDLDRGNDVIAAGAFDETLKNRAGKIKLLWNHRSDLMPIGVPQLSAEGSNLLVEGVLSETVMGKEAAILLADGALKEFSIGYNTIDSVEEEGVRTIKELELFEVSLVNFPMNENAVVTAVKNLDVKHLEHVLREAGYSRSQSKAIANNGLKSLREADKTPEEHEEKALIETLSALLNDFNK